MTEVLLPPTAGGPFVQPKQIPRHPKPSLPAAPVMIPEPRSARSGHLSLDVFSPVNQNGSFEFDRVLKSGEVYKRTRKTKQWKRFYLVLRPNLLSMYKNSSEERLHKQITLSDLTAVASIKDPKGRRQHTFGLFSPSRNYHFQADSGKDAREWVDMIRRESRIDEDELEMVLAAPLAENSVYQSLGHAVQSTEEFTCSDQDRMASSSPEPAYPSSRPSTTRDGIPIPGIQRHSVQDLTYSGNELGSYSDFSDSGPVPFYGHNSSRPSSNPRARDFSEGNAPAASVNTALAGKPAVRQNMSQTSVLPIEKAEERVIWHGYLLCLKSKGGVRQWKKLWAVLRPKNLTFYKNEEEYAAHLLIPLSNIISAVEIDPISKSKSHCMQIIAEDKSYRFCAMSEEALARWLGALKSQLARRKEAKLRMACVS